MTTSAIPQGPEAPSPQQLDIQQRTAAKIQMAQYRERLLRAARMQSDQFYTQAVRGELSQDFPAGGTPVDQMRHVANAAAYPGEAKDIHRSIESIPDPSTQQAILGMHAQRKGQAGAFEDGIEAGRVLAERSIGAQAGLGALRNAATMHMADPGSAHEILLSQSENYTQLPLRAKDVQRDFMARGQGAPTLDHVLSRLTRQPAPGKSLDERGWVPPMQKGLSPETLELDPRVRQEAWLEGALQGYQQRMQATTGGERATTTLSQGLGTVGGFLYGMPGAAMKGLGGLGRTLVEGAARKTLAKEVFQGTFGPAAERAVQLFGTKAAASPGWRMLAGAAQHAGAATALGAYEGMAPLSPEEEAWADKQSSPSAAKVKLRGLRAAVGVAMYPIFELATKFGGMAGNLTAGAAPSTARRVAGKAVEGASMGFGFDAMSALQDTPAFRGAVEDLTGKDPGVRTALGRFVQTAFREDATADEIKGAALEYAHAVGLGSMAPFAMLHAMHGLTQAGAFKSEQIANWQRATEGLKSLARENFKQTGDAELMRFLAAGGNLDTLLKEQPIQVDIQHSPEFIAQREGLRERVLREQSLDERAKQIERYDPEMRSALGQEYRRAADAEKARAGEVAASEEATRAQQEARSERTAQEAEEGAPRRKYLDQESQDARRIAASFLEGSYSWREIQRAKAEREAMSKEYDAAVNERRTLAERTRIEPKPGATPEEEARAAQAALSTQDAARLEKIRAVERRARELDDTVRHFWPEAEKQQVDRARRAAAWEDYARRVDQARENPDLPLPERPAVEDFRERVQSEPPVREAKPDAARSEAAVSKKGTRFVMKGEEFRTVKQEGGVTEAKSSSGRTVKFPRSWFKQTPAITKEPSSVQQAPERPAPQAVRPAEGPQAVPAAPAGGSPAEHPAGPRTSVPEAAGASTAPREAGPERVPTGSGEPRKPVVTTAEDIASPFRAIPKGGGEPGDVEIVQSGGEHQAFVRKADGELDTQFAGVGATLADAVADLKDSLERAGRPWDLVPREEGQVGKAVLEASQKAEAEVETRLQEKSERERVAADDADREATVRAKAEEKLRSMEGIELRATGEHGRLGGTVGKLMIQAMPSGWGVWGKKGALYLEGLPTAEDAAMAARIIQAAKNSEEGIQLAMAAVSRYADQVHGLEAMDLALRNALFGEIKVPREAAPAGPEDALRQRVLEAGGISGSHDALKDIPPSYRRKSGAPIDQMAERLIREGLLKVGPDQQPEDALANALKGSAAAETSEAMARERASKAQAQAESEMESRRQVLSRLTAARRAAERDPEGPAERELWKTMESISKDEHTSWLASLAKTIKTYGEMFKRTGPDDSMGQWIRTQLDNLWSEAAAALEHPLAEKVTPELRALRAMMEAHQKGLRNQAGFMYVPLGVIPGLSSRSVWGIINGKYDPLFGDQTMRASRDAWSKDRGWLHKLYDVTMGGPEGIFGTKVFRHAVEAELRFTRDVSKWSERVRGHLFFKPHSETDRAMARALDAKVADKAVALDNLDAAAISEGFTPKQARESYDALRDVYRFFKQALVRNNAVYRALSEKLKRPTTTPQEADAIRLRLEEFRREWGISEYFTHTFEDAWRPETGWTQGAPKFLAEGGVPTKVGLRFEASRKGAEGWIESAYAAFDKYLPAAIRKVHYDQLLRQLDPIVNGVTTRVGDRGLRVLDPGAEVIVDGAVMRFRSYDPTTRTVSVEHPFTRRRETVKANDVLVKAGGLLKSGTTWVSKQWDAYRDSLLHRDVLDATRFNRKVISVASKLRGFLYHTTIGALNVKSAATNLLGGQFMSLAELGPERWLAGVQASNLALHGGSGTIKVKGKKLDAQDLERILKRSGIMDQDILHEDVLAPQLQGLAHQAWKAVRQASFLPFSWAEAKNRSTAYLGGWIAAREAGASQVDAHWAGVRSVERTQFIYSPSATPRLFKSQLAKTAFQLSQYGFRFMGTLGREMGEAVRTGQPDRLLRFVATAGLIGWTMNQFGQDVSRLFGTKFQDLPFGEDLTAYLQTKYGMQPDGMTPWSGFIPGLQSPQGFAPVPKLVGELLAATYKTTVNGDERAFFEFAQKNKGALISQSLVRYMQFAHLDESGDPQAPIALKRPASFMEALLPTLRPTGSTKENVTLNELLRRSFVPGTTKKQLASEQFQRNAHYQGQLETQMRENMYDHLIRWQSLSQEGKAKDAEVEFGLARQIAEREGIRPDRQAMIERWRKTQAPSYLLTILQGGSRQQKAERVLEFIKAGSMTRQEVLTSLQALRGQGRIDPSTAKELSALVSPTESH